MNNKQKRAIKKAAQTEKAILQIGKNEITETLLEQIQSALDKRELIKISVLQNAGEETKTYLEQLKANLMIDFSYTIGHTIVLYAPSSKKENRNLSLVVKELGED